MSRVAAMIQRLGTTCTVARESTAVDNGGYAVVTATDTFTMPILVQPRSAAEAVRYGRESTLRFDVAYAPATFDVRQTDRIRFTSPRHGTRTMRVNGVRLPDERALNDNLAYLILDLEEIKE